MCSFPQVGFGLGSDEARPGHFDRFLKKPDSKVMTEKGSVTTPTWFTLEEGNQFNPPTQQNLTFTGSAEHWSPVSEGAKGAGFPLLILCN